MSQFDPVRVLPAALSACLACLLGCAAERSRPRTAGDAQTRFSRAGESAVTASWWRAFDDSQLDRLVTEALRSNLDLETAWHRLHEARAVARRESAPLVPQLDAFVSAEAQRPNRFDADYLRLGLSAEYELDLWGRLRSRAEAERYRARASVGDYQTIVLSIAAEVSRTWYQVVEARLQVELLDDQLETNQKVLTLLENRLGSGQIRGVDILRQRQLVSATEAQILTARSRLSLLQHQLAVLLGRHPGAELPSGPNALPELPPLPRTGLPAELVVRRPDVRRAYDRLLAADADLAAAVSERYPRLSISASLGTSQRSSADLFQNWFANLAANLIAPLIDGGRRRAEVDRNQAVVQQRLSQYGQAVLVALREVEDALVLEENEEKRIEQLEQQIAMTQRTYEQLQLEYLSGIGDYIDVLTALTTEQALRRDLLTARRALLEYRVALYRALAGGFMPDRSSS